MPSGVYPRTAEHNAAISAAQLRRFEDPAAHAIARAAQLRRYDEDPDARAITSACMRGHPVSAEARAKISARLMGHSVTPATRAKQSRGQTKARQRIFLASIFYKCGAGGHREGREPASPSQRTS